MPVKLSPAFTPLFSPLRIDYAWEGCFEYDRLCDGHSWCLSDSHSWRRVSVEVTRGGRPVVAKSVVALPLVKSAQRYTPKMESAIVQKAKGASGKHVNAKDWQLLSWLRATASGDKKVGRGLSLVLNALVRLSTTKSFEVLSTFVGEHVTVEVRELGSHFPSWFYLRGVSFEDLDEYLVSFPELFVEGGRLQPNVTEILRDLLYVRCLHHYDVLRIEQTHKVIRVTLRDRATIVHYPRGATCGSIPVPGVPRAKARKEPGGVNAPEVVVTSPVVGNALAQLSRVWQDPYAKNVLISSPAGSGKEVFASSIPIGNGRPADRVFSMSMASEDQRGLERKLYGFLKADGTLEDGLIAKAANAALFLDEVHQPETAGAETHPSSARASLLRTLEAGTYFPQESSSQKDVKNILWIMATSKPLKDLKNFTPIDFWTRMGHAYEIPHPLAFPNARLMRTVVADFFRTFWWDQCDKHYDMDPSGDLDASSVNTVPAYWQQRSMLAVLVDEKGLRLKKGTADIFASRFLSGLASRKAAPTEFSVRGIRNMVARLFAIAWSNVAQGREPYDSVADFNRHVDEIFSEIYSVARLEGARRKKRPVAASSRG